MHSSSIGIIGGADGPTAVFVTTNTGFPWINTYGLFFLVLLLIPNIIYAVKNRNQQNLCTNRLMNILEQIGRYGCMLLMVFDFGVFKFGFASVGALFVYLLGNLALLFAYWIVWLLYFKKPTWPRQLALAILPMCLFLQSGITLRHPLLILCSLLFGISHIYVTSKNRTE